MDLKRVKSQVERAKGEEELGRSCFRDRLELKKASSIDEGKQRKQSSIEEKISKIREKILKTEQAERPSSNNPLKLKESICSIRGLDSTAKQMRLG
jgi:hypothetical protein